MTHKSFSTEPGQDHACSLSLQQPLVPPPHSYAVKSKGRGESVAEITVNTSTSVTSSPCNGAWYSADNPVKDLNAIRRAYRAGDVALSRSLHAISAFKCKESSTSTPCNTKQPTSNCRLPLSPPIDDGVNGNNHHTKEYEQSRTDYENHHAHDLSDPDSSDAEGGGDGHDHHSHHLELHGWTQSEYLKAAVFGGLDGIVTIFAVVAGCVGARLTAAQLIVVGLGNLLADATSMGFGEYVSAKAAADLTETELERETWEVKNIPDEEKKEMIDIYMNRHNFSIQDAKAMVDITFKYQKFFISHMMVEELGLLCDQDDDSTTPLKRGCVMFTAFALFGVIPLAAFIAYQTTEVAGDNLISQAGNSAFLVAALASMLTLFVLGIVKAHFVGGKPSNSGFMMVLNGTVAGALAFGVGTGLQLYVSS